LRPPSGFASQNTIRRDAKDGRPLCGERQKNEPGKAQRQKFVGSLKGLRRTIAFNRGIPFMQRKNPSCHRGGRGAFG
jgi:hypothetical protein